MQHRSHASGAALRTALAVALVLGLLCAPLALPGQAWAQDETPAPTEPADLPATDTPATEEQATPAAVTEDPAATPEVSTEVAEPTPAPDVTNLGPTEPDVLPSAVDPASELAALAGQTVKIIANKDTFIASNQAGANFGGLDNLDAGWYGNYGAVRPMVKFNLGAVPGRAKIYGAQLVMFLQFGLPAGDGGMTLNGAPIRSDWSEGGATWANSAGNYGTQFRLGSVGAGSGWVSFNVTSQVQSWVNGSSNNGLMIIGNENPNPARARIFSSRHVGGQEPYLLVNYECDTVPPRSQMSALPQFSPGTFTVSWSGQDFAPSGCKPTGIAQFFVDYRINGGSWVRWQTTSATSATFRNLAPNNSQVDFRVWAEDRAGNVEARPSGAQATTRVDSAPPVMTFTPLPQFTTTPSFPVSWTATDDVSGVASYDVQFNIDGGGFANLLVNTTQTSTVFQNALDERTYGFRGRARDRVGNVSSWPSNEQVQTTVVLRPTAKMVPFANNIISSTSPVTSTIALQWTSSTPPGTTITNFQIWYRFWDANNNTSGWVQWPQAIPGNQNSIQFPWTTLWTGTEGRVDFEVLATNNQGQTTTRTGIPEATMLIDLQDKIAPRIYFPYVTSFQ